MKKYGITENDIEIEAVDIAWFRYKEYSEKRLLHQIIYMVMGECDTYIQRGSTNRKHKLIGVYCTAAERLEIEMNFEFFNSAMQVELKTFYSAFMQKNRLFPPDDKARPASARDELSNEELIKLSFMMEGIERHTLKKMIAGGNADV